ncbi:MAG: Fic family protein [Candidatus Aegiribacteria sp.]|nr:Fic family protein [Candidatus Aegiribacteria sp.]
MTIDRDSGSTDRPAGYTALIERYSLNVIPNWHRSCIAMINRHVVDKKEGIVRETYPARYWPGNSLGDHLEFALKYDGTNMAILAKIFHLVSIDEMVRFVQSKPTGKYMRRLWYIFEKTTGTQLPVGDLTQGNYLYVLEPSKYYTTDSIKRISRQRVLDNFLGNDQFCPIVRRTEVLTDFETASLQESCREVMSSFPPDILGRALSYLYTKETKSSFEIEHITPTADRMDRFVSLLGNSEHEDFCDKNHLIMLQNQIVDSRFADSDYRRTQNYISSTISWDHEKIHYVCPKPDDIPDLMSGLVNTHLRISGGGIHPVVHAAVISYGFVFLHPFDDGNGRIHRFLIHNILALRGFTPAQCIFPVSASMLKNPVEYNASLESLSNPLLPLIDYQLDNEGRMTVTNETGVWYRYIDLTLQTEALFAFIENTIHTELVEELTFLTNHDNARNALCRIVDMPDRLISLFIKLCVQNNGYLSRNKRLSHFSSLSDREVMRMEQAIRNVYDLDSI